MAGAIISLEESSYEEIRALIGLARPNAGMPVADEYFNNILSSVRQNHVSKAHILLLSAMFGANFTNLL